MSFVFSYRKADNTLTLKSIVLNWTVLSRHDNTVNVHQLTKTESQIKWCDWPNTITVNTAGFINSSICTFCDLRVHQNRRVSSGVQTRLTLYAQSGRRRIKFMQAGSINLTSVLEMLCLERKWYWRARLHTYSTVAWLITIVWRHHYGDVIAKQNQQTDYQSWK